MNSAGPIEDIEQLDERLSRPTPQLVDHLAQLEGDLIVLGIGGKMGPTLARMAKRASEEAGVPRRVIGVSRFSGPGLRERLEGWGIETIAGDLLDGDFMASLPEAPLVMSMVGMKFGATGNESLTWAMNAHLPSLICRKFARSRIMAFSTGNVYGLVPVTSGGSLETDPLRPEGEYAMSGLGRERMYEHFSRTQGTPMTILRLNYACELRYGVLVDLAQKVYAGKPVDLSMGVANVIWQGDANAVALHALGCTSSPPFVLNITGPETLSVRQVCERLGEQMGREPQFTGEPRPDALLNNSQLAHRMFGYPEVSVHQLIDWIAAWVAAGGESLGKPTKFEVRDGRF
ncbi:NAD-dependent epimerase/dehydratase family protein [Candidatus Laterigemmans baculatus]|nr:NAD-dependent epimerase/dehydratase family protein [Candidatus Laterigemmans baculatus]